MGPYCKRSGGWMTVPVCERVTGHEKVVDDSSAVEGSVVPCRSVRTLRCARFLRSSPDGPATIYDHGVPAVRNTRPGT